MPVSVPAAGSSTSDKAARQPPHRVCEPHRLTDRERRQAFSAVLAVFSTVLGPLGPLAVWGLEYLYDRRDLIFNVAGAPVSAYTADRSALNLTALPNNIVQPWVTQSTLSIDTSLTDSARRLGLRGGDPVSLLAGLTKTVLEIVLEAEMSEHLDRCCSVTSVSVTA